MLDTSLAISTAGALGVAMALLWLVSLPIRNSSIVDIFWGLGFVLVAWMSLVDGHGALERKVLTAALTSLWGIRLAGYLAWRNLGHGEDPRYAKMRRHFGARWPLLSFVIVFVLQACLLWTVSLPLQVAATCASPSSLTALDGIGAVVVLGGVLFESIGDFQLARFKALPGNRGKVMNRGLWRFTRHPNYFGDFCVWWGFYLIAAATGIGAWTIVSPLLMSFLLMRVSGVPLLEKSMRSRPGYDEYLRQTSAFFPRRPTIQ